ncbi:glycosyl transferase [Geoalkalibacter subterraneus]|uniref:Glycosyl transferase n=1 Tax=Geoalkalibacter subterraneus TaxID=483547 RepID=A0A0B5FTS4_9BACT|nr:glycosyl transferase [Geoalkalibacter subterraneus]
MHIVHLTSVHSRYDTRIFLKECTSLADQGFTVSLVVADGNGDEACDGVHFYDVGASKGRLDRIRNAPARVYKKALELNADLYHLHDPELIPIGIKLKHAGKKVIFDSHEDVPRQLLSKHYLNKTALKIISKIYAIYEKWTSRKLDGIIAATPFIRDKFLPINPVTVDINNFPLLPELESQTSWDDKQPEVCYVGGIAKIRGIHEVVDAMGLVQSDFTLNLCGQFGNPTTEDAVKNSPGWKRVKAHGFVNRAGVRDVLSRSVAGVVTFHPLPNHLDAQPNKMFEYMSAGIPVIASDFPLWRQIIEGNQCGLLVDPLDAKSIAEAIDYLVMHPEEARKMGENGRRAIEDKYNWQAEEKKLLDFYQQILKG